MYHGKYHVNTSIDARMSDCHDSGKLRRWRVAKDYQENELVVCKQDVLITRNALESRANQCWM
jgi:hypothetical protein